MNDFQKGGGYKYISTLDVHGNKVGNFHKREALKSKLKSKKKRYFKEISEYDK